MAKSVHNRSDVTQQSAHILSAVGFAASEFLKSTDWKDPLESVLKQLGTAVGANRAYYFENSFGDDGELLTSQVAEWVAPGITPQIDNSELQNVAFRGAGMDRWVDLMSQGKPVHGLISEFPESEQELLESQDIQSLVVMPVFSRNNFTGFIGFDDCENLRQWEAPEFDALFAAANALGAAIERQRLEDQLRFSQKMDAIGTLASGVAHDFNNMLQVIVALVQVAKFKIDEDHPAQEDLNDLLAASGQSETLTRQLLVFSSKQDTQRQVVDLGETCESVCTMLRPVLGNTITLSLKVTEPAPTIFVNPGLFIQVLMNLCLNARDAMPDGGSLDIKCNSVELSQAAIGYESDAQPGRFACVTVQDTGSGMATEVSEKIFEPFYTTKEQGTGTGLGLSVAYGIIKQCNGLIRVNTNVGRGSRFSIFVPVTEKNATNNCSQSTEPGSATILLVDDEPLVLHSIELVLQAAGYKLLTAENGLDALNIYREQHDQIDAILTDSSMPGMTGPELLQQALGINPKVKGILFSGFVEGLPDSLNNHKNFSVLQKPLQQDAIKKSIRELLA